MIEFAQDNLLKADAEALVNTVRPMIERAFAEQWMKIPRLVPYNSGVPAR